MALINCIEPGCENEFEITDGEKAFYEGKGMKLPKRCPPCRSKRKALKGRMAHPSGGEHNSERY
jgi:Probable zinc-ribbon domain